MYLDHFNLREKPFKIGTDPRFLWLGGKHNEALATVRYGILYNDGYVVVTGGVGTGKTTLATALIDDLGDHVVAAKVAYPRVETLDFFKMISAAYGIADDFHSKGSFFVRFDSFLRSSSAKGKKVVLIIDEAQTLSHEHLEELLHLSNIEQDGTRLLNIVFIGQNDFNDILTEESNKALRQRVAVNCELGPLTEDETREYILHRLRVAQCERPVFSPEAIEHIFRFSQGIPRLINVVCDLALVMRYFEGGEIVEAKTIERCVQRLRLPGEQAELAWDEVPFLPDREKKAGDESGDEIGDETTGAPVEENLRKPARWRVAVGAAFGLLVLVLGVVFFAYRQVNIRQTSTSDEPKTEAAQEKAGTGTEAGPRKGKDVPGVRSAAEKERELSGGAGGNSEQAAQTDEKAEEPVVARATTEGEKRADSAISAGPAEEASSGVPREAGGSSDEEKSRSDQGKAAPDDRGERLAPSPSSSIEGSRQETSSQEAEVMEADKLIEWVLEKRSEKQ
jgi:type II secretory pathway predicted ATPase ExeA